MKSLISIQIIGATKLLHAKQAQLLQLALTINLSSTKAIMLPPFPPELSGKDTWHLLVQDGASASVLKTGEIPTIIDKVLASNNCSEWSNM